MCCILKKNLKIAPVAMKNLFYTETKAFFKAACTGCKLKRPVGEAWRRKALCAEIRPRKAAGVLHTLLAAQKFYLESAMEI